MRVLACTILTIGTMLVAAPARAQTYDPNYPVCLQTYGIAAAISTAALLHWRSAPRGAMPEQPLFRAWRQETVSATQRLLEAGASACVGGAMLNFAHAIASTYSQAKPPIP